MPGVAAGPSYYKGKAYPSFEAAMAAQDAEQNAPPPQAEPQMPASVAALSNYGTTPGTTLPNYEQYRDPASGQGVVNFTNPNSSTNLYQTGDTGGTAVSGKGTLSEGAYEKQQQSQLGAKLQAEAEARRLGYLSTITGQQSPQVPNQAGPASDENAARSAAFARAKEQAGQTALASMKALEDVMASSGKMGSSVEGQMKAGVMGGAAHDINDFTRSQLMMDLNRASEVGDRNYAGQIQQRGQNLSLIPSLMGLITQTGGVY